MPVAGVHELRQQLPALTRGEGVLECAFDRYEAVSGTVPTRPRIDNNPLNWEEYLLGASPGARAGPPASGRRRAGEPHRRRRDRRVAARWSCAAGMVRPVKRRRWRATP